jgi:hypothetical protein
MGKSIFIKGRIVILMILISPIFLNAQDWSGKKSPSFYSAWSVNISSGFTSYFGDLSKYDQDIAKKLFHESGPGIALTLTKNIRAFGVSGQLLFGNLKAENNYNDSFRASFLEYNIQARANIVRIIAPHADLNFGLNLYSGLGQFVFQSTRFRYFEGSEQKYINNTGIPEFVFFFGGQFTYKVSNRIEITTDLALRQSQNDKLDNLVKNNDFDYYAFTSVGLTYSIYDIFAFSRKKGNNLANSFVKFKPKKNRKLKPPASFS